MKLNELIKGINMKFKYNYVEKNINAVADYIKSDSFEDDLDYFIMNLQMFDTDLNVPDMNRSSRNQQITKKIKLVKQSFKRLNLEYGPVGGTLGSLFGPKGMITGSFLGSYFFVGCLGVTIYQKFKSKNTIILQQKLSL